MAAKSELKTGLLRATASIVLWICLLGALLLCLSPLAGGSGIAVAYGLGIAVAGLLSFSSLTVVATMAEDIRALRDSSEPTDQPKTTVELSNGTATTNEIQTEEKEVGGISGSADVILVVLALSLLLLVGVAVILAYV